MASCRGSRVRVCACLSSGTSDLVNRAMGSSDYTICGSARLELYARTSNLFNREWEENATSDATIDLDQETPHITVEHGVPVMWYGGMRMYRLALVSALRTDDRMFTCRGDVFLNDDVIAIYREVTRVIDNRIISFPGTYGCSTAYTGVGLGSCTADDVVPYIFTSNSPLRGTVDFNELLPVGEAQQRRVIIVNVTKYGRFLADQNIIPDGSVVYLAGRHNELQRQSFRQRFNGCKEGSCAHGCG